ncbi:MAG: hypothetical protein IJ461_05895 [Clostridia bacterium]|nr:hypothetical protein [Clostridia bacterium]
MESGNAQSMGEQCYEYAKKCMDFYFGRDIELVNGYIAVEYMNEMRLEYRYLPKHLTIEIEASRGFLDASIIREDGGYRFLSNLHTERLPFQEREEHTQWYYRPLDIEVAIAFMVKMVQQDIVFHIRKGKKLYADEGGTLRLLPT